MFYRLDIRVGGVVLAAPASEQFENLELAQREAAAAARALAAERVASGRLIDNDAVLVREDSGSVVHEVTLSDMIRY